MIALGRVPHHEIGLECSGVITAVGVEAASEFSIGDRVCALIDKQGAYANFVRSSAHKSARILDNMDFSPPPRFLSSLLPRSIH